MTYPSSLTDTQWQLIETIFEDQMLHRRRVWPLRSIFDAIFYVLKGGIQWRMMPTDLPPWQTVYCYYRKWQDEWLLGDAPRLSPRKSGANMARKILQVWG